MSGLSLAFCTTALVRGFISRPAVTPACREGLRRVPSLLRGAHSDSDSVKPPRLMLLSSGLTTPDLEATFRGMLHEAAAGAAEPRITMVVTGQMTPSNEAGGACTCTCTCT